MPRRQVNTAWESESRFRPLGTINLQAYSPSVPVPVPAGQILQTPFVAPTQNASQEFRQRFGRSISLDRIESALRSAYRGSMRAITDLSRETVDTDPHLASVVNKRFRALSGLPWTIVPASGPGVDKEKALFYASVVKQQIKSMAQFRRTLTQLAWALFDGRAAQELIWLELNPGDGMSSPRFGPVRVAIKETAWIHPRRLSFDSSRQLRVTEETFDSVGGNFTNVGLPLNSIPFKFMQWTPQLFGDYPEREGLAQRVLYWSFFKRFSARERMILLELFGKPWRIISVDEESTASPEDLTSADSTVDNLGGSFTARMPRGTKLDVVQPQRNAGQVHSEVIKDSDNQISKLVLGQTGTTDGVPAGLNSNQANVMQDEQLMILQTDASMLSEIIESQLTDLIIALNFGSGEVTHAPHFVLRSDIPADRKSELERLDGALKAGLAITREEAYEISGFSIPDEGDTTIRIEQPPTPPLSPVAPAARPIVIYPVGASPVVGEQNPAAATADQDEGSQEESTTAQVGVVDSSTTITVNEDRASRGLDALSLPDGSRDPDGDLPVSTFKAKQVAEIDAAAAAAAAEVAITAQSTEVSAVVQTHTHTLPGGGITASSAGGPNHTHELPNGGDTGAPVQRGSGHVHTLDDGETGPDKDDGGDDGEDPDPEGGDGGPGGVGTSQFESRGATPTLALDASRVVNSLWGVGVPLKEARQIANTALDVSIAQLQVEEATQCAACVDEILSSIDLIREQAQPETENGSVETLISRTVSDTRSRMRSMADLFKRAAKGQVSPAVILQRLAQARAEVDVEGLADAIAPTLIQSAALGAFDAAAEAETGNPDIGEERTTAEPISVTTSKVQLADVSKMSFEDALKFLNLKEPIQRHLFDQLSSIAKRRAFTVAGVLSDQVLATIQAELARQVEKGADFREFAAFIEERLISAGFLEHLVDLKDGRRALSASHVEVVFRTNMLNSYNAGRHAQMTQPEVLAARPVWEFRSVRDGRTRRTHRNVHGKKLLASDPFWLTAYPPYGFNCRCRVVSKSASQIPNVLAGGDIRGLPDPGFTSGTSRLLR